MNIKSLFWIFLIVFVVYFTLCLSGNLNLVFSPSSEASVGSRLVIGGTDPIDEISGGGGSIVVKYDCEDGKDNDGDGLIDFPLDPGCSDETDNDETDYLSDEFDYCENKCDPGNLVCSDDLVYKRCGYYGNDDCLDWSEDISCDDNYICQDDFGCLLVEEPEIVAVEGFNYCNILLVLLFVILFFIILKYCNKSK